MDAQHPLSNSPEQKVCAATEHLDRVRAIAQSPAIQRVNQPSVESAQLAAYVAEAELWLAQAKAGETEKPRDAGSGEGTKDGRGNDPKSQAILAKLDKPISMPFNEDTPLEDVLKYIKQATTTLDLPGIPIYVDPSASRKRKSR